MVLVTSGFSSDENTVVARLDVEIPTDGVENLAQIQKTTQQLASATESIARSQEDYNNYLRELPQLLRDSSNAAPPRPALSESETKEQLESLRERDPQQYRNFLVQRGEEINSSSLGQGNRTSSQGSGFREDFVSDVTAEMTSSASSGFGGALTEGVVQGVVSQRAAGLLGQSLGMGRTGASTGGLVSQITSGFAGGAAAGGAASGLGMGSLGALARGGVPGLLAAGTVGGAVVGYNKLQEGAETYQNYKNLGMTRGGGAQEGLGFEFQTRMMALNPFINTEQSRQIINSALSEGYTGKEFDTLTGFMVENLKEMNLSAAESMKLFQKNVKSGGASVGELNTQLETLKSLSKDGAKTLQDRQEGFTAVSSSLIDSGLGGTEAGQTAVLSGEMFSDDQDLKSVFDTMISSGSGNPRVLSQLGLASGLGPMNPYEVEQTLADRGPTGIPDAYWQLIRQVANTSVVKNNWDRGNKAAATNYFKQMLQSRLGMTLTVNQAMKLLERAYAPDSINDVFESQSKIDEAQYGVTKDSGFLDAGADLLGSAGSAADVLGHAVTDTLGGISNLLSGDMDRIKGTYNDTADATRKAQRKDQVNYQKYRVQRFDDLVSEFGVGGIEMQDAEGNRIDPLKWGQDKQVMEDLASGKNKVRVNGGEWTTLKDSWGSSAKSSTGGSGDEKVTFDLTPRAAELLRPSDRRTQNQSQADSGYSDATRNRVPPGDR